MSSPPLIDAPSRPAFVPSLEGLRGVAAVAIVVTHVAFQTGLDPRSFGGSIAARLDFGVAVFFALSGFVLWRRHAADRGAAAARTYYAARAVRIAPAYLVCVAVVLFVFPVAFSATGRQVIAQFTLTQIYHASGLVGGLTQLWSLCVEVAFYLVVPLLAALLGRLPSRRWRVAVIVAVALASFSWGWLPGIDGQPDAAAGEVNRQIWPPAYASWFAVGMLAAEAEAAGVVGPRWRRVLGWRPLWWAAALATVWVAGQEWFGPIGLTHPSAGQFAARVGAGMVCAVCVVVPYALAPSPRDLLARPALLAVGRWSYSLFLWHVAVLSLVFPALGREVFSGGFVPVLVVTLLASLAVAAASYELVEAPCSRWWRGRAHARAASMARAAQARSGESPA
ncbi:acyltransferase family protein [Corynebacterium uberis]|uniref:acyltransferase family protein n=1 Tax=Corynebacterium TaxID=1716 RepID=UPI001D0AAF88|nr:MULTISPECIES: acyltransferase [Corynebacterium]MCZ9309627.1 acyltransferase [Corynebacterium sp. c6VSa_13]UDL73433.1 acyltransferase [Corynebacterium uberis]UDL75687.1 acyltransferase [Corynebacterium uberis]UDL77900.1 acyltransferase [Corynebacterium uberis]UDL80183.1 acyltransferase [Corynebacterium uberis]